MITHLARPGLRGLACALTSLLGAVASASELRPIRCPEPAWTIEPWEHERLTAADVVGPDGFVYPNVSWTGVLGGIPDLEDPELRRGYRIFDVTDHGATGDDEGNDDQAVDAALAAAIAHCRAGGRAILYFPEGRFHLRTNKPIAADHLVIEGASRELTRIVIQAGGDRGSLFDIRGKWTDKREVVGVVERGSPSFTIDDAGGWEIGEWVQIRTEGPSTTLCETYSKPDIGVIYDSGHVKRNFYGRIVSIDGTRVTLDRPITYPIHDDDGARAWARGARTGCGIQHLTIETRAGGIESHHFDHAADCWMLDVDLEKVHNHPIRCGSATNIEYRDVHFAGTHASGKGGTAYFGPGVGSGQAWGGSAYILIADCRATGYRHHAIFQWTHSSVIRDTVMYGDRGGGAELHGRFPWDNVIEGCTFEMGGGIAVDPAHTLRHGPNGPRMILYNNRFAAPGFRLLGCGGDGYVIAYNRLEAAGGELLHAVDRSSNGILHGNVYRQSSGPLKHPLAIFEDPSSSGWVLSGNRIHGGGNLLYEGDGTPRRIDDNRFLAAVDELPLPRPPVPSIVDWIAAHASQPRLVALTQSANLVGDAEGRLRIVRVGGAIDRAQTVRLSADEGLDLPSTATIPAGTSYVDLPLRSASVGALRRAQITVAAEGLLADEVAVDLLPTDHGIDFGRGPGDYRSPGLPEGWHCADWGFVGDGDHAGRSAGADGRFTLTGSGETLRTYLGLRQFGRHVAWTSVVGDGTIVARLEATEGVAQTGLLVMDDQAHHSEYLLFLADGQVLSSGSLNTSHAATIEYRKGGEAPTLPLWMKLERRGAVFTCSTSTDGRTWSPVASVDFYAWDAEGTSSQDYLSQSTLDPVMHFGLFVNSGSRERTGTAVFSEVTVTGERHSGQP